MKVKAILLNGKTFETIEIDNEEPGCCEILKILGINELQGYFTFGNGYTAFWQEEKREKTSMEITTYAGADRPIFIDSKVVIVKEDFNTGDFTDVDFNELKLHFNMGKNRYWALVKL